VNTRSSQSVDAQLKDFTLGSLAQCESSLVTTPKLVNGTAADNIPAGGTSITTAGSIEVKDSANLTVTGIDTWSGNLKFFLCGPPSVDAAGSTCDGTAGKVGTQIGALAGLSVNQSTPNPILSDAATITSVGRYCWRGVFTSATSGVDSKTDSTTGECFTVNPVTPTLTTTGGADVLLGNPISDTATLSGTARQPTNPIINSGTTGALAGGSITFKLYGPGIANCNNLATGFPAAGITRQVSGDNTYPTNAQAEVSFIPGAVGTYYWKAVYSGNSPNTNASAEHNTLCDQNGEPGESDEAVTVSSVPTTTTTRQSVFPQDRVKIAASVGGDLAGTVTFSLYDSLANCQAATATGRLFGPDSHSISGASPQFAQTNNTTARISSDAIVYWNVQYDSTNNAQDDSGSTCVESTDVDFTGDDSSISYP
jgi:hypothetical protein